MALLKKTTEIPKDAVILKEHEAMEYAWELVYEWKKISEVWALRYGSNILGGLSAISGVVLNNHFRRKLKLINYGYFASVIPITVMPGLLTILFHRFTVSSEILLMKKSHCPVCYEVRSAGIQLALGFVYPLVLAPTTALMLANRYNTYRVPELREGPRVVLKFVGKILKPITGTLVALSVCQLAASSFVTYFEMKNNIMLRNKIMEIEKQIESE